MGDDTEEIVAARLFTASVKSGQCNKTADETVKILLQHHEAIQKSDITGAQTPLLTEMIGLMEEVMQRKSSPLADSRSGFSADAKEAYAREDDDGPGRVFPIDTGCSKSFADVIGCADAIQVIREAVVFPMKYPIVFEKSRATAWRGALLYGPPGTGKSLLARAAAGEANIPLFHTSCADLTSKWVGGSERLVRNLFAAARAQSPCIVFLDEIDSVASSRSTEKSVADQRLTTQLLVELDTNITQAANVFVLAATNLPWTLDSALLRRLPKKIYIHLPNEMDRFHILKRHISDDLHIQDDVLHEISRNSHGFSGSDLQNFVNDLIMQPLRMLLTAKTFCVERRTCDSSVSAVRPYTANACRHESDEVVTETDFDCMVQRYGEICIEMPILSNDMVRDTLASYRKNVCHVDTSAYEHFERE